MAEAQNSLAVVLPGSTGLSEICLCIRPKGVISTVKKEYLLSRGVFPCLFPPKRKTVRNHAMFIRFLGVVCPFLALK